jgi:hypothetical protein
VVAAGQTLVEDEHWERAVVLLVEEDHPIASPQV